MNQGLLQHSLNAIVRQVIALAKPRRILLFGSAAKGQWQPNSDLDLLVVVDNDQKPDSVLDLLNTKVQRTTVPCDFLVVTPRVLRRQKSNPGLIYRQILEEGREVYAA